MEQQRHRLVQHLLAEQEQHCIRWAPAAYITPHDKLCHSQAVQLRQRLLLGRWLSVPASCRRWRWTRRHGTSRWWRCRLARPRAHSDSLAGLSSSCCCTPQGCSPAAPPSLPVMPAFRQVLLDVWHGCGHLCPEAPNINFYTKRVKSRQ
jgi:hypothetical protein